MASLEEQITNCKKRQLLALKQRYGAKTRTGLNLVNHHADCSIYRAKELYGLAPCTCGLLHDLEVLPLNVAQILYPSFVEEKLFSEVTWEEEQRIRSRKLEDIADTYRNLRNLWGEPTKDTNEDIEEDTALVKEIFGELKANEEV